MQIQKKVEVRMKKILFISFIIAVGVFLIIAKFGGEEKLFAQVLPGNLNEASEIQEITIYEVKPTGKPKEISLVEKEEIDKILTSTKEMKLKEGNEFVSSGYLLMIQGYSDSYSMTVNLDGYIDMDGHKEHYKIKGNNRLVHAIQDFRDKWEILDEEA